MEARAAWSELVSNARNVVRQANTFYPYGPAGDLQRNRLAGSVTAFVWRQVRSEKGDNGPVGGSLVEAGTGGARLAAELPPCWRPPRQSRCATTSAGRRLGGRSWLGRVTRVTYWFGAKG